MKLLIFDWDGTLSDSTGKIIDCVQKAAGSTGFEVLADETIRNIIGLGLPEAMRRLYPDLNEVEKQKIKDAYVENFLAQDQNPSPFFHGVEQGLQQLRDTGFAMAVATGKSRRGLDRVFQNLDMQKFFDGSRCADETASKPDPLMLQELLAEFSVSPEQALMVGDTEYDMEMAQTANVHRVAVSYGAHHIDRLLPYEPVLRVNAFNEFVDWVITNYS